MGCGAQLNYPRTQTAEAILRAMYVQMARPDVSEPKWNAAPRLTDLYFIVKPGDGWEAKLEEKAWKSAWR